jgi:hypothetical protein
MRRSARNTLPSLGKIFRCEESRNRRRAGVFDPANGALGKAVGPPSDRRIDMQRKSSFAVLAALTLFLAAGAAQAKDGRRAEEHFDRKGDRVERHLDRKGDRIDRHLDRKGDRIDRRLDRRADHARTAGKPWLARRLDHKGDRIDRHLDRKGDRIDRRWDRRGDRWDRRFDRHGRRAGHWVRRHQ